jgi:hypothetical protein
MSDTDVVQWFFYLEAVTKGLNWPVHVDSLAKSKRRLDEKISAKAAATDVLACYKQLAGAIGPTVMTALLESDDAFPEVNHSDKPTPPADGRVTLYVDTSGQRVLATVNKVWGMESPLTVE